MTATEAVHVESGSYEPDVAADAAPFSAAATHYNRLMNFYNACRQ